MLRNNKGTIVRVEALESSKVDLWLLVIYTLRSSLDSFVQKRLEGNPPYKRQFISGVKTDSSNGYTSVPIETLMENLKVERP